MLKFPRIAPRCGALRAFAGTYSGEQVGPADGRTSIVTGSAHSSRTRGCGRPAYRPAVQAGSGPGACARPPRQPLLKFTPGGLKLFRQNLCSRRPFGDPRSPNTSGRILAPSRARKPCREAESRSTRPNYSRGYRCNRRTPPEDPNSCIGAACRLPNRVLAALDAVAAGEVQHEHLVEARDGVEVETFEMFDDGEPGLPEPGSPGW